MSDVPDLQLLLCDPEQNPVLEEGLKKETLDSVRAPKRGPRGQDSYQLEALHGDPNDLEAQRWAVIAPEGQGGDAALAAVAGLIEHRKSQQGAAPFIYRVPAGMDARQSQQWKHGVLRDEEVALDERPRYLLILGDLDNVSLELQHVLANGSFVGRLHCPTVAGYRAYAEKVVARETGECVSQARSLFYTAQDGTAAVGIGYRHLVEPCMRMQSDLAGRGKLSIDGPEEIPYSDWGPDELLMMAGDESPSLLCSVSHGLGAPHKGWKSPDHQRQLQGALAVAPDEPLTADMVREMPFLPGGIWFCVACFGAGTPPESAYHGWLSLLSETGAVHRNQINAVLKSLPATGERPFVAALPQALLANPNGPLAVIGHMDLAWTFGFTDPSSKRSRASRMLAVQRAILAGSRSGVSLDTLMHVYRETNDELMAGYQLQRDAAARGQADPVSPGKLGKLWMQRNDLRGYVLLGDPATRLAIVPGRSAVAAEIPDIDELPAIDVRSARVEEAPVVQEADTKASTEVLGNPPETVEEPNRVVTSAVATTNPSAEEPTVASLSTADTRSEQVASDRPPLSNTQHAAGSHTSHVHGGPQSPPPSNTQHSPGAHMRAGDGAPLHPLSPVSPGAHFPPPASTPYSVATQASHEHVGSSQSSSLSGVPQTSHAVHPQSALPGMRQSDQVVGYSGGVQQSHSSQSPFPGGYPRTAPHMPHREVNMSPQSPSVPPQSFHSVPQGVHAHRPNDAYSAPAPTGAAPLAAVGRPLTLENPTIALRERAVLALIRGDEAPRSIAARFGLPLEEVFYWLDLYREAGRRALGG